MAFEMPPSEKIIWTRMHWFRFWTHPQRYRRRRAYFRPSDTSDLDATLLPLVDHIVAVRFAEVGGAGSRFAGERLYSIVGQGTPAPTFVRPERDFDFLE
jgi:hypothetical protein